MQMKKQKNKCVFPGQKKTNAHPFRCFQHLRKFHNTRMEDFLENFHFGPQRRLFVGRKLLLVDDFYGHVFPVDSLDT